MKRIDLSGQKFGRITVLSYYRTDDKWIIYYLCKRECGKEKVICGDSLKGGRTKSCGCLNIEQRKNKRKNHNAWSGHGDISLSYFNSLKSGAEKRGFIFDITIEQVWDLFVKQNRKCALSGVDLNFQSKISERNGSSSLDRIDSNIGYLPDNIQWVHKKINTMKMSLSDSEFLEWCQKVVLFSKKEG